MDFKYTNSWSQTSSVAMEYLPTTPEHFPTATSATPLGTGPVPMDFKYTNSWSQTSSVAMEYMPTTPEHSPTGPISTPHGTGPVPMDFKYTNSWSQNGSDSSTYSGRDHDVEAIECSVGNRWEPSVEESCLVAGEDFLPTTPEYLPTTPEYLPTTPEYLPSTPEYLPTTPKYMPLTPEHSSTGPIATPLGTGPVPMDFKYTNSWSQNGSDSSTYSGRDHDVEAIECSVGNRWEPSVEESCLVAGEDFLPTTPEYLPTTPEYLPSTPEYLPSTPEYLPTTPKYMPLTPEHSSTGPIATPLGTGPVPMDFKYTNSWSQNGSDSSTYSGRDHDVEAIECSVGNRWEPSVEESCLVAGENFLPTTPEYLPTTPEYLPSTPEYLPSTPEYLPTTPKYMPTTPEHSSTGPIATPLGTGPVPMDFKYTNSWSQNGSDSSTYSGRDHDVEAIECSVGNRLEPSVEESCLVTGEDFLPCTPSSTPPGSGPVPMEID